MLNELAHLRDDPHLQLLLSYYAEAGIAVPGEWQDRLMELAGVEPRTLTRLHGELIAFDWIETDSVSIARTCYRVTGAGLWAHKQVLCGLADADDVVAGIAVRAVAGRALASERRAQRRRQRTERSKNPP